MYPLVCCLGCGKALGDKYNDFRNIALKRQALLNKSKKIVRGMYYSGGSNLDYPQMDDVLDALYITKNCCRQHMLSQVLLVDFLIGGNNSLK